MPDPLRTSPPADRIAPDGGTSDQRDLTADVSGFVEQVARDLLGYFARRLTPFDDAADAFGECLLVIWKRREALPVDLGDRRAWAFGVAHNVLRNARRGRGRRIALNDKLRRHLIDDVTVESDDDHPELLAAVDALSFADRELVLLVAWDGFSTSAAAAILHITPVAARKRMSRIRQKLARTLGSPRSALREPPDQSP